MEHENSGDMVLNVLYLEDSVRDFEIIRELLADAGYDLHMDRVATEKEFVSMLKNNSYDVILADFKLPGFDAFSALELSKNINPAIPFVCVSGAIGEETAIQLIKRGADDYVLKDRLARLPVSVKQAIDHMKDTQERMRLDRALRESEEKYRSIFDYSHDAILLTATDGSIFEANQAACNMFGRSVDEIRALGRRGLVDETDPRLHAALKERADKGQASAEFTMIRANGDRFPAEVTSSIFAEASGQQRTSMIIRDITKRKETEEALKESEERYRSIFDNVVEGIFQTRPEGSFIKVNQAMARIHGFESPGEMTTNIVNIADQLYVDPEDRKKYAETLKERGTVRDFEAKVYRKDGSTIWTAVNARAVKDNDGNILYFEGTVVDVTKRRNAAEELKVSAEKLRKNLIGTIQVIAMMLETRDPYTAGHQRRVSSLARSIAQEMDLPRDTIETIRMAGNIHDIGKMSVPAEILAKPTRLNDIEMRLIKGHPQTGYDILRVVELPYPIAEIVLQHHERLDGSGYPQGLKQNELLLEAQIISVADVVEAMASHRPYRPALGLDTALREIEKNKGVLYSEQVVEICLMLFRKKEFKFD